MFPCQRINTSAPAPPSAHSLHICLLTHHFGTLLFQLRTANVIIDIFFSSMALAYILLRDKIFSPEIEGLEHRNADVFCGATGWYLFVMSPFLKLVATDSYLKIEC